MESLKIDLSPSEPESRVVVGVTTSYWNSKRGVHITKNITKLKRLSYGYDLLFDDCRELGPEEVIPTITNLNDVEDGVYRVLAVNEDYDWERGYCDGYDYLLEKFNPESKDA